MPSTQSWIALAAALIMCFAVAAIGAKITAPQIPTWYAGLLKPSWTPPRIAFPIVWPILYALMAIAAWRFWEAQPSGARTAVLWLFAAQLALNAIWSPVFFGLHRITAALVVIAALDVVLAVTIVVALNVSLFAASILLPYLAWTIFATALNARIWMLNPANG